MLLDALGGAAEGIISRPWDGYEKNGSLVSTMNEPFSWSVGWTGLENWQPCYLGICDHIFERLTWLCVTTSYRYEPLPVLHATIPSLSPLPLSLSLYLSLSFQSKSKIFLYVFSGVTGAVSKLTLGLRNTLDSKEKKRAEHRYKNPSEEEEN